MTTYFRLKSQVSFRWNSMGPVRQPNQYPVKLPRIPAANKPAQSVTISTSILPSAQKNPSEKKRSRASIGGNGGFDKKQKTEEKKPHKKDRLRDKKNKGKPDFAAKRAKKAAALKAKEQV